MPTNIQWTDLTDNIIRAKDGGWWCRKISPGCANCYSEKLNQNTFFGGNKQPYSGQPPELILDTEIIRKWGFQKKPKKHFVASMTDVFG
ncbi:phage Gp37/Gp68 family protein [Nostoc sp. CHAB 5844]|nr:phage Gp37/Gp68 family protein [Nostoc sp. CHAB 5844]